MCTIPWISIAFLGALSAAAVEWFFRGTLTSFDLRGWVWAALALSWMLGIGLGHWSARLVRQTWSVPAWPLRLLCGVAASFAVYLVFPCLWQLCEEIVLRIREATLPPSDLGHSYFYHDLSGSGYSRGILDLPGTALALLRWMPLVAPCLLAICLALTGLEELLRYRSAARQ